MELRFNLRRRKGRIRQEVEIYRETIVAKGQTPVVNDGNRAGRKLLIVGDDVCRSSCLRSGDLHGVLEVIFEIREGLSRFCRPDRWDHIILCNSTKKMA